MPREAQKVDVLETSLRELQKKLSDTQLALDQAKAREVSLSATLLSRQAADSGKIELRALLSLVDKEIAQKKKELAMASPISLDDNKGDLYVRIEEELKSLAARRIEVVAQLTRTLGQR